jgi:hypothetical protein
MRRLDFGDTVSKVQLMNHVLGLYYQVPFRYNRLVITITAVGTKRIIRATQRKAYLFPDL